MIKKMNYLDVFSWSNFSFKFMANFTCAPVSNTDLTVEACRQTCLMSTLNIVRR